ncbi:response regulator transcription factor [Streptacidiphilus sp. 4-A2]|nr:response regulator transcription factor [Streptacidiphilus sp. 4-A2]
METTESRMDHAMMNSQQTLLMISEFERELRECPPDWSAEMHRANDLSEREEQVFAYLGFGYSNRTIAQRLGITERTVKAHVAQILAKLGLESRLQAGIVSHQRRVNRRPSS